MLWKNFDGKYLRDDAVVPGPDGAVYGPTWDKASLPFLEAITEVPPPSGAGIVVTGFHDESGVQVWDTRPMTADEHNRTIIAELSRIDSKRVRPSSAVALAMAQQVAPAQADLDRLAELEAEAAALRSQLQ